MERKTVRKMSFIDSVTKTLQNHGLYDCYDISRDLSHKKTGNFWITTQINFGGDWMHAGINTDNGMFLFVVGDYDEFYILSKKHLQTVAKKHEIRTSKDGSTRGFLMNSKELQHINIVNLTIDQKLIPTL